MAIACRLCAAAIGLAVATLTQAQLSNGSFENGLTGWTGFNFNFVLGTGTGATGPLASGSPHSGLNVLQLYGPFTGSWDASGVYQDLPTGPGVAWTLSGYGMNPSGDPMLPTGTGFGILQIAWNGGALGTIDSGQINKSAGMQDQWQALSVSGTAPAGTTFVRLLALHVNGPDFSGGSAYFDSLQAVPEPSSILLALTGLVGVWLLSRKRRA